MRLIEGITDQPKQQTTLTLLDGSKVTLYLQYKPNQTGWFFDVQWGSNPAINGQRLVASPNVLRQYINTIPFGIACMTDGNVDPLNQEDFADSTAQLYLLEGADIYTVENLAFGVPLPALPPVTTSPGGTLMPFLPTSWGPAGGDLAFTYPNPWVIAVHETSGPTQLLMGAIPDGYYLKRSGASLIGVAPPGGSGTVTSVAAGAGLLASPSPIVAAGTISMPNVGTPGTYGRVTTDAQGRVSTGYNDVVNVLNFAGVDPTGATDSSAGLALALAALPVGGPLQRIWIDNPGSGYTSAPTVVFSSGGGAATAVVNDGLLVAILITTPSNYATIPTISFTGGGGTGATAYAIIGTPCALVLPPGFYKNTGLTIPANIGCLDIIGLGATLYCTSVSNSCITYPDSVNMTRIYGLTLQHQFNPAKWGNNLGGGSRDSGCGIRLKGRFHQLYNLRFFQNCEFGLNVGDDPSQAIPTRFIQVINCIAENTCGDGFHFQYAQDWECIGCIARRTGDDAFAAVCDTAGQQYNQRGKFADCLSEDAYGCGCRIESCFQIDVTDIEIIGSRQEGICLSSQNGVGACENINIIGGSIRNPNYFDPTIGVGRGIVSELSGSGVLNNITISGMTISDTQTSNGQGIYLSAFSAGTIKNVMICGNNFRNIGATNYIFTQSMTVASVVRNNTCLGSANSYADYYSTGLVTANNT